MKATAMKKRLNVDNKKLTVSRDLAGAVRAGKRFVVVGVCGWRGGKPFKPFFTACARRRRVDAENEILLHHLFNADGMRFMECWHYDAKKDLLLPVAAPKGCASPFQAKKWTMESLEQFQNGKYTIIL